MARTKQVVVIPSNPEDRKKLGDSVRDLSGIMMVISGHQAVIKEGIDALAEQYDLPKKMIRQMIKVHFEQSFNSKVSEEKDFAELYCEVFGE